MYTTIIRRFCRHPVPISSSSFRFSTSTKKVVAPPKNQGRNYVTGELLYPTVHFSLTPIPSLLTDLVLFCIWYLLVVLIQPLH